MIVGAYRLVGKIVQLKKPLVMYDKRSAQVQSVFRSKVLFDTRPTLVFSQPVNKKL